ncbi:MAG TPA: ATP-binding cassette domain-containing protein, partial [Acidimicrobiia bacterium]
SHRINPNMLSATILLFALLSAQGQVPVLARLRRRRTVWELPQVAGSHPAVVASREDEVPRLPSRELVGAGIGVTFGGVRAVDGMDVRVAPGQRVAIMGSNGAGKTTLVNALCGFVPLTQGRVTLGDDDITTMPAFARARAGLGRSFQLPRLADVLTVRQNVECWHGYSPDLAERLDWLMDRFWVRAVADVPVEMLSFGFRRRTEIMRALVPLPEVLLLDEPVGGLEDEEVAKLIDVILELQAEDGWGLLVIEHNLDFAKGIAEHLMVMQNGTLITEGPVAEVWEDERVRRIYLGETMPAAAAGAV